MFVLAYILFELYDYPISAMFFLWPYIKKTNPFLIYIHPHTSVNYANKMGRI